MKLFVVDSDRESTLIHRVLVDDGKYLMPKKINGTFDKQCKELLMLILQERPEKIIFDNFGIGNVLSDIFGDLADRSGILIQDDGTLIY